MVGLRAFLLLILLVAIIPKNSFAIRLNENGGEKTIDDYQRPINDNQTKPGNVWVPYMATKEYDPNEQFIIGKSLWHLHTKYSDGFYTTVETLVQKAKKKGYNIVFFSDHTDMMIEKETYDEYIESIKKINEDGKFVVFPGREITIGSTKGNFCHVNAFSFAEKQYLYSSKYSINDLPEILERLDSEGSFYVVNHVEACPNWRYKISNFHGMEFFNDFPGVREFDYLKRLYVENLSNGWRGYVVGGVDYHFPHENMYRGFTSTFIFTKKLDQKNIFDGIREGRTVAATEGLLIKELSLAPSLYKYIVKNDDYIIINGELTFTESLPADPNIYLVVPSEHPYGKKFDLTRLGKTKNYAFHIVLDSSYNDKRFFLEIPGFMITSPYEIKILNPSEQPTATHRKKAFKIIDAYFDNRDILQIRTEDDSITDLFRFYEICEERYLMRLKNGKIVGCSDPVMLVGTIDGTGRALIDSAYCFSTLFSSSREACTTRLKNSYMIEIGENDYRGVVTSGFDTSQTLLVTSNTNVSNGDLFRVCDVGNISFDDETGEILDCNPLYSNISIRREEGKILPRLNLFDSGMYVSFQNYFIVIKER